MKKQKIDKELSLESYNEDDNNAKEYEKEYKQVMRKIDTLSNKMEELRDSLNYADDDKQYNRIVSKIDGLGEKYDYWNERATELERILAYYNINKSESLKESLQSEYKQAFDLLIEGANIVGTLDTDFGKQFVKDVGNLYKLKPNLKLSVAKEMLKDIQGYLVDEQYDDFNKRIDKFMNNSKNESIKEYYYTNQDYEKDLKDNSKKLKKETNKLPYTDEEDELDAIAYNVKKIAKQIDKDSDKFLDAGLEESLNEDIKKLNEEIENFLQNT